MQEKNCNRCGGCCLANPCFEIIFGQEIFIEIDGLKIHKCPHLSFTNNIATCLIFKNCHTFKNSKCTSNHSLDFYQKYIDKKHLIY